MLRPASRGALARWLAQAGWWVPLPSLGAAPELGGYDGGGDGAHTRNGGALARWLTQAGCMHAAHAWHTCIEYMYGTAVRL
jgi:hypothetical protein